MNNKKSAEASLENQKSLNFLLGLVLVLSLIYIVLEWSDKDVKIYDKPQIVFEDNTDMDIIQNFQDIMFSLPPEDIEPEASAVIEEIDIVTNSVEVAEINFQPNESELLIDDTSFAEDVLPDNELQEDNIFHFVDKMPMFVGGEAALMRWLNDNIQYPANAQIYGIQGKVICQFIVNRDGSLSNIEVIKSVDPLLDNAAINALKKMPKWLAGELREKPVRVKFTLPIVFSMH